MNKPIVPHRVAAIIISRGAVLFIFILCLVLPRFAKVNPLSIGAE